MTSPPGHAPTTQPFGELITGTEPDLSTRNGQLRYLVDELGVTRRQAQALIRAYALDQRDVSASAAAHAEAQATGAFRDAHSAAADEFRGWLRSNYWACMRGGIYARAAS